MSAPAPAPYRLRDLPEALGVGWQVFRAQPGPSLVLGVLVALIGAALWLALAYLGATPLGWVLSGGFLLIGPALLAIEGCFPWVQNPTPMVWLQPIRSPTGPRMDRCRAEARPTGPWEIGEPWGP